MPRTAREQSTTGIYHVMLRGINRQDIFEEPEDYMKIIKTLSSLTKMTETTPDGMRKKICTCHIYAYCVMPNHVHLLIQENEWTLGQCVKYIADIYVRYYNMKYGRVGHLLQDRFRSEPCNNEAYFIVLIRYIHQNPVKAGLANSAGDYDYSSWKNDYLNLGETHVCTTDPVIRKYTFAELIAWVDMPVSGDCGCMEVNEKRLIPDIEVRDAVIKACGLRSISDFQLLTLERKKDVIREVLPYVPASPRQLSRVTGMNYETVRSIVIGSQGSQGDRRLGS